MTEQIKELEKALRGSLMHENECAFVHTSTIKICLDSLQAWEEVLTELEHEKQMCFEHDSDEGFVYARAIDIINQKLAEIEE